MWMLYPWVQHPPVDTGQKKCYNNLAEITPPASGQEFYGQDGQLEGIQPDYTLNDDGKTVLDESTQLTWMRGPNTTLTPPVASDKKTFDEAGEWVAAVNAVNYDGFSDWRLPTIKELYSLMNFDGTDPSGYNSAGTAGLTPFIDTTYFNFGYGQTSAGERIIDSQYASTDVYVVDTGDNGLRKLFGLNLADGRIKGYDLSMPDGREKTLSTAPAASAAIPKSSRPTLLPLPARSQNTGLPIPAMPKAPRATPCADSTMPAWCGMRIDQVATVPDPFGARNSIPPVAWRSTLFSNMIFFQYL